MVASSQTPTPPLPSIPSRAREKRIKEESSGQASRAHSQETELWTFTDRSLQDLGLFHHFTCVTYKSLSDDRALDSIWREAMPREAVAHTFLLHGVLALSALHIASARPTEAAHYQSIALQHHEAALGEFRSTLAQMNRANSSALFAFSSVAVFVTFALEKPSSDGGAMQTAANKDPIDDMLQISALFKGIGTVLSASLDWVRAGPLGTLADLGTGESDPEALDMECHAALDALEARINALGDEDDSLCVPASLPVSSAAAGAGAGARRIACPRECYMQTVVALRATLIKSVSPPQRRRWALAWLTTLQEPFTNALRCREKLALANFVFFGVMLHYFRNLWWIGSRGALIVDAAVAAIGPGWDDVLAWPKKQVLMTNDHDDPGPRPGSR